MFDGKQLSRKLVGSEDERAVSPVIGVILMVAITVILAAVIAAFVLDLGGDIGAEAQAGANIDTDLAAEETQVTWTTQGNSERLIATINMSDDGDEVGQTVELTSVGSSHTFEPDDEWDINAGSAISIDEGERVSGEVTVVGETDDGTQTVVASDTVEWEASENDTELDDS